MSEREEAVEAVLQTFADPVSWVARRQMAEYIVELSHERDEARRERDAYAQTAWWAKEFALELLPLVKAAVAGRPLTDSELDLAIESNANAQRIKNAWETAVKLTAVRALDAEAQP